MIKYQSDVILLVERWYQYYITEKKSHLRQENEKMEMRPCGNICLKYACILHNNIDAITLERVMVTKVFPGINLKMMIVSMFLRQ